MLYSISMPVPIDVDFIIDKCPIGLLVFDKQSDIVYSNRRAELFLKRYELPSEINIVSKRIFEAIASGTVREMFPGEIYITNRFDASQSNWIFRLYIYEKPVPLVYVTIIEERLSNKLEMNGIRQRFRLTRRETDVLRRVIDGLKNIEIADDLAISEQTVKDHLSNIYMKTGVGNKLALVRTLMHVSAEQSD
jgi:DNA-binding CsgD family transcriptional regulator